MNISIITLTFPPEPAQHLLDLARSLAAKGHRVRVLTSLPSYPYGRIYEGYRRRLISIEKSENLTIIRLPVIPSHSKSLLKRGLFYFSNFISTLFFQLLTSLKKNDLTIAYQPPLTCAFPALAMKFIKRERYVLWIQDLWPETLVEAGLTNKNILKIIIFLIGIIYRHSEHIIVLSPGFKSNLVGKGVDPGKISIVYNWFKPSDQAVEISEKSSLAQLDPDHRNYKILYAGNLGEMQALDSVIKAFSLIGNAQPIMLFLLGSGTRDQELRKLTRELKLEEKIVFLGRVPPGEVYRYYDFADALIVHIRDSFLFRITIPHKIYEYMMAAKPIIAAIQGDARDEILAAQAGIACEPENSKSIAEAIIGLFSMDPEKQKNLGKNGQRFVRENRSPEILIKNIENTLLNLFNMDMSKKKGGSTL